LERLDDTSVTCTACVGQPKWDNFSFVENSNALQTYFRKQVKALRDSKRLSQAQLAEMLRDKGFSAAHPSTVAKIEAGDRPTSLAELQAFAAAFDVSVDLLICEPTRAPRDTALVVRLLAETALVGHSQVQAIESELRAAIAALTGATKLTQIRTETETAADALAAAAVALDAIGKGPMRVKRVKFPAPPRVDEK
jgi:transcriptional regulator with XRE-family HTH domain